MRIKLKQVAENLGADSVEGLILEHGQDSIVPACCSEGCEVEPDGTCEHDCPSILLAAGLI